jgi:hypothetical protein
MMRLMVAAVLFLVPLATAGAQRDRVALPDIPGYVTLKGDFHMHTVFSDGSVWPSLRSQEAIRDGLDFIALTDHIDFQGNPNELAKDYNRPAAIAASAAARSRLIVIKGAEISPRTPPYHSNAVFLTDANLPTPYMSDTRGQFVMKPDLTKADLLAPFVEAKKQGAFITYNHPAYFYDWSEAMGPDLLTPLHREMLKDGMLHGVEIVNGERYYGRAHRIAMDNDLTLIAGSDAHGESITAYRDVHRPMTLVFSRDSTAEGLKEALFARRTAVWHRDLVIGRKRELEPFFRASLDVTTAQSRRYNEPMLAVHLRNKSDIPFTVKVSGRYGLDNLPLGRIVLAPRATTTVMVRTLWEFPATVSLDMNVENLMTAPDETLETSIEVQPAWKR